MPTRIVTKLILLRPILITIAIGDATISPKIPQYVIDGNFANNHSINFATAKIPTITQKDLANALGITQRKVSFMETGTTEPSLSDIKALCNYFNVSADYLLGLPKNMNYPE